MRKRSGSEKATKTSPRGLLLSDTQPVKNHKYHRKGSERLVRLFCNRRKPPITGIYGTLINSCFRLFANYNKIVLVRNSSYCNNVGHLHLLTVMLLSRLHLGVPLLNMFIFYELTLITQVLYITIVDRHFGSNHVQYTYLYYVPINFKV